MKSYTTKVLLTLMLAVLLIASVSSFGNAAYLRLDDSGDASGYWEVVMDGVTARVHFNRTDSSTDNIEFYISGTEEAKSRSVLDTAAGNHTIARGNDIEVITNSPTEIQLRITGNWNLNTTGAALANSTSINCIYTFNDKNEIWQDLTWVTSGSISVTDDTYQSTLGIHDTALTNVELIYENSGDESTVAVDTETAFTATDYIAVKSDEFWGMIKTFQDDTGIGIYNLEETGGTGVGGSTKIDVGTVTAGTYKLINVIKFYPVGEIELDGRDKPDTAPTLITKDVHGILDDAVGLWWMGEASGAVEDYINDTDLTCSNVTYDTDGGIDFNGSNSYCEDTSPNAALDFGTGSFTVCALVECDNLNGYRTILGFNQSAGTDYDDFQLGTDSAEDVYVWDSGWIVQTSSSPLNDNVESLVCTVRDGSTWYIFVDGVDESDTPGTGSADYDFVELGVGTLDDGTDENWDGGIKFIGMWDEALTANQIKALYESLWFWATASSESLNVLDRLTIGDQWADTEIGSVSEPTPSADPRDYGYDPADYGEVRYVRQSGGTHTTLISALEDSASAVDLLVVIDYDNREEDNAGNTIDVDTWTSATVVAVGDSRHPGYIPGTPTHYRLRKGSTGGGEVFENTKPLTIDGVDIQSESTGSSHEIFRITTAGDLTVKNCLVGFATPSNEQDIVYYSGSGSFNITFENCMIYGVERAVIDFLDATGTYIINVNSCSLFDIGHHNSTRHGLVGTGSGNANTDITVNVFNTFIETDGVGSVCEFDTDGTIVLNVDDSITDIVSWEDNADTFNDGANNVESATFQDTTPASDVVYLTDDDTNPYDLRLQTDFTYNIAQRAHNQVEGANSNLILPIKDIAGNIRNRNSITIGAYQPTYHPTTGHYANDLIIPATIGESGFASDGKLHVALNRQYGRSKPANTAAEETLNAKDYKTLADKFDGCWAFNDASGSTIEDQCGTNDLTLSGGYTWVTGGVDFNGSTGKAAGSSVSTYSYGTGDFTVCVLATIDAQISTSGLWSNHDSNFAMVFSGGETFRGYINGTDFSGSAGYDDDVKRMYCMRRSGSTATLWVDGSIDATTTNAGSVGTGSMTMEIAEAFSGYTDGTIDATYVSGDALTTAEMELLAENPYAMFAKHDGDIILDRTRLDLKGRIYDYPTMTGDPPIDWLVGYWKMDDNAASTTVVDELGNNDGTLEGGDDTEDLDSTDAVRGTSLLFDGTADYITLSGVIDELSDTDKFTIEMKFKPNFAYDGSGDYQIFGIGSGSTDRLEVRYQDSDDKFELNNDIANINEIYELTEAYTSNDQLQQFHTLTVAVDLDEDYVFVAINDNHTFAPITESWSATPTILRIARGLGTVEAPIYLDEVKVYSRAILPYGGYYLGNDQRGDYATAHGDIDAYLKGDEDNTDSLKIGTGTVTENGVVAYGTDPWGNANSAFLMEDSADNIAIDPANLPFDDFSISFWFKWTEDEADSTFYSCQAGYQQLSLFRNGTNDQLSLYYNTNQPFSSEVVPDIWDGNWHHIKVTHRHDGTNLNTKLFIDGVEEASDSGVENVETSWGTAIYFGNSGDLGADHIGGYMSDITITDNSLTPQWPQVLGEGEIWRPRLSGPTATGHDCSGDLKFAWDFEETNIDEGIYPGCYDGNDSDMTLAGGASLDSGKDPINGNKVGYFEADESITTDNTGTDRIDYDEGKIILYSYIENFELTQTLFWAGDGGDESDYIWITTDGDAADIDYRIRYSGNSTTSDCTVNSNHSEDEWVYLEIQWKVGATGDDLYIKACDEDGTTNCVTKTVGCSITTAIDENLTDIQLGDDVNTNFIHRMDALEIYGTASDL